MECHCEQCYIYVIFLSFIWFLYSIDPYFTICEEGLDFPMIRAEKQKAWKRLIIFYLYAGIKADDDDCSLLVLVVELYH